MDIVNILKDLCEKYPSFATKDEDVQVVPYTPTSIFFFYKDREFFYDVELGVLQILYKGTIQSVYASRSNPKGEDDKI